MINRTKKFLTEVKTELKKVSWSTKDELLSAITVVLVSVFLLAVFIGLCDFILSGIIGRLIK